MLSRFVIVYILIFIEVAAKEVLVEGLATSAYDIAVLLFKRRHKSTVVTLGYGTEIVTVVT